jgi:hypothetical protein
MKLCLPEVTLLAVTPVDIEETHQAILYRAKGINFGAIQLLNPTPPKRSNPRVTQVSALQFNDLSYVRFIFGSLHHFVSTKHCLIIQADGIVLNPERWLAKFTSTVVMNSAALRR